MPLSICHALIFIVLCVESFFKTYMEFPFVHDINIYLIFMQLLHPYIPVVSCNLQCVAVLFCSAMMSVYDKILYTCLRNVTKIIIVHCVLALDSRRDLTTVYPIHRPAKRFLGEPVLPAGDAPHSGIALQRITTYTCQIAIVRHRESTSVTARATELSSIAVLPAVDRNPAAFCRRDARNT